MFIVLVPIYEPLEGLDKDSERKATVGVVRRKFRVDVKAFKD